MYFPQATGFVRMTLGAHRCDVIMGFPQGDDLVQGTNPYYRTAYALVAKQGSGLEDVATLEDERLKGKHIGIVAGTPPATNMAVNGLMANAKPYQLMVDTRIDSSAEAMIGDLTSGKIDAAILWGPMAGFYAKKANPPLHVTPLVKEKTGPRLAFRIGMGVRGADQNWKRLLNRLIQENQPAINKILLDFGVPLLDENDRPIGAETATKVAMKETLAGLILAAFTFIVSTSAQERPPEPDGYRMEDYRAPVPATLAGVRVLTTAEAERDLASKGAACSSTCCRARQSRKIFPQGTVWRDKPRLNIPGSVWLPDTGYGKLAAATEDYLRRGLVRATAGNTTALVVIYCQADCWMSWNAAKRILTYGYSNVAWYPEGTDGWERAGLRSGGVATGSRGQVREARCK